MASVGFGEPTQSKEITAASMEDVSIHYQQRDIQIIIDDQLAPLIHSGIGTLLSEVFVLTLFINKSIIHSFDLAQNIFLTGS